jgi:energy-coupling factor transporter ATP-binding protein EcfA2
MMTYNRILLLGKRGSGKTSMLLVLQGLLNPFEIVVHESFSSNNNNNHHRRRIRMQVPTNNHNIPPVLL